MPVSQTDLDDNPLIAVRLNSQEIGAMYAAKYSPFEFSQYLLARLKEKGGPVEGTEGLKLTLAHGKLLKVRTPVDGAQGVFDYLWLPEPWIAALNEQGGLYDPAHPEGVKVH